MAASCSACVQGKYSGEGAAVCSNCVGGTFSNVTQATECYPCEPGFWSSEGAPLCSPCAAGGYSLGGTSFCFECTQGSFSLTGFARCLPCGAGTYSDVGAPACLACAPGTYSLWEQGSCSACPAGMYSAGEAATECSECVVGTWSALGAPSCTACRAGTYSLTPLANSSDACLLCSYGKFSTAIGADSEDVCAFCPIGEYTPEGSSFCRLCPANLYTDGVNPGCLACPSYSTSIEGARLDQCLCDSGYETMWREDRLWFTCNKCVAGKFSASKGTARCALCSPGTYGSLGLDGNGMGQCFSCTAGTYSSGQGETVCANCDKGFFQAVSGQTVCNLCPLGFFSDSAASVNCSACLSGTAGGPGVRENCSVCIPGTYTNVSAASACTQCESGKYLDTRSGTSCHPCAAGTFSTALGISNGSACTPCRPGYFSQIEGANTDAACRVCLPGFTSNPGAFECFPCPAGQLANTQFGACSTCPVHSTPPENITSLDQCMCSAGYYLGYNSKAHGGEEAYERGSNGQLYKIHTFNSFTEGIWVLVPAEIGVSCRGVQISQQYLWNPGYYPSRITSSMCRLPYVMSYPVDVEFDGNKTSTHVQCIPCPKGTFSTTGGAWDDCLACPRGKYQDDAGQTVCKPCPNGTDSFLGADICRPCQEGTVYYNSSCVGCPDGFYTRQENGTLSCVPCENNTWSNSISGGCRLCPSQSSSPGGTGIEGCRCFAGLELSIFSNVPYCIRCAPGKYAAAASNRCILCPAGSFSRSDAAASCAACPNGHAWFAPPGSTVCSWCPPRRTATQGKDNCTTCPRGSVCNPQSLTIVPCPTGTYDNVGGLSSLSECSPCPGNYFCLTPTSIEACPVGTYSLPGAINKHGCLCTDMYDCVYTTSTTTRLALSINQADWEAQREQLIASIAASLGQSFFVCVFCLQRSWLTVLHAGVRPDQIKISWVPSPTTRRMFSSAGMRDNMGSIHVSVQIVDMPKRRGIARRLAAHRLRLLKADNWKSRNVTTTKRRPLRK